MQEVLISDMNRAEGSIRMDGMAFEMDLKWKYPDLVLCGCIDAARV